MSMRLSMWVVAAAALTRETVEGIGGVFFRARDPRALADWMVRQLREASIEVRVDPQEYPNGRFARVHDPEGNPIELWEPKRN